MRKAPNSVYKKDELRREAKELRKRIATEESKDMLEQDHAQIAWLINKMECVENRISKASDSQMSYNYTILE